MIAPETLDTIHAQVQQETSARAEKLARMQGLLTRTQSVKELQAKLNAEVQAIQDAFAIEMNPLVAVAS
ncbi:hypothetical protein [Methylobacterium ajmalii]|uniref:hypothetical protein n=1 Tax=Methylobacterium ajmalii TaxID=2738439 RepID=UPI00190CFC55|nr:hypothetical protein [Methylobacterium ajmalii]MBK3400396.1 hypothetical protein [Methylobacterium ajmalii]MBK3407562.1 hypothetical protein [Methylobacterium ajmalii]MBK3422089.1 hypothetical protein [Methylobacterium ajmalii]MBZ6415640.1 hypothetical protein [Methylobacterium sp.]